jgi:hypothetical protein
MTEIEIISERIEQLKKMLATLQGQLQTLQREKALLIFQRITNERETAH